MPPLWHHPAERVQQESQALRMMEYVGSVMYVVMQSYIFKQQYNTFTGLVDEVEEYKSIDEVIGTVETEGESKDDDTVRKYS